MQLEKAKQVAESLLRSREKLMLTISHDIRAPLSSIIGYIELLLRRHPDERQQYYLENMKGSSDHILSLVNDLLDFQRLESGEMEVHSVPFRVPVLFDEIYTSFQPIAEAKGLRFVLNLKPEETGQVYMGDPIRIRQVVGNLLSNAIKFTEAGRVVLLVSLQKLSIINYQFYKSLRQRHREATGLMVGLGDQLLHGGDQQLLAFMIDTQKDVDCRLIHVCYLS